MSYSPQDMLGRPSLLWTLEHPRRGRAECLAAELNTGDFLVRVLRSGREYVTAVFPTIVAALDWAGDMEHGLLAHGWRQSVAWNP